jgi:uncharacterized membrane protein YhdT
VLCLWAWVRAVVGAWLRVRYVVGASTVAHHAQCVMGACDFGQHSGAPCIGAPLLLYIAMAHLYVVRHC